MKTKTLLLLCFIAAFYVNAVKAQNGVVKDVAIGTVDMFLECTGDYVYGEITYIGFLTPLGWTEQVKNGTLIGYLDAGHLNPSGRVYEISQTDNGKFSGMRGESTARIRLEGKLVAIVRYSWHTTTNANGTVTADYIRSTVECK
jgi:hypothetical protein